MTGVPKSNSQLLLLVNLFTVLTLHTISSVVIVIVIIVLTSGEVNLMITGSRNEMAADRGQSRGLQGSLGG